ncbi:MAG: pilus assembly protein N-terminal domain-containing protein, partial [Candidatus Eremiobacteraeota bacterium]|nr:pilus assembly protein N-terminal domain-containing protein [Candidatus Eremiobacteraeota bacterium]
MRRVLAPFCSLALVVAAALAASAQVNPPVPPPSTGPVNPPGNVVTPVPAASASPGASASPAESASPVPTATPTPPPIVVEPPQLNVEPGKTVTGRINSALGDVTSTVADATVATAVVDQAQRVLYVTGVKVGTTTVTLTDTRGVTRDVPVRVAYAAGVVADETSLRVTGNPTSTDYLREAIVTAVTRAATARLGATVTVAPDGSIPLRGDLKIDDRLELDVPVR